MVRPKSNLLASEQITISPTVLIVDQYRAEFESEILTRLVVNFNNKSLTEREAFLSIAEIAAIRNLVSSMAKQF